MQMKFSGGNSTLGNRSGGGILPGRESSDGRIARYQHSEENHSKLFLPLPNNQLWFVTHKQ